MNSLLSKLQSLIRYFYSRHLRYWQDCFHVWTWLVWISALGGGIAARIQLIPACLGGWLLKQNVKSNYPDCGQQNTEHRTENTEFRKQGLCRTRKLWQCTNWKVNLKICELAKASNEESWPIQLISPAGGPFSWSFQLVCPADPSSWSVQLVRPAGPSS